MSKVLFDDSNDMRTWYLIAHDHLPTKIRNESVKDYCKEITAAHTAVLADKLIVFSVTASRHRVT